MLKKLLFKNVLGVALMSFSCSFIIMNEFGEREINKNQIVVSGKLMNLHFGGLEEKGADQWLNIPRALHFKTNMYLSDVHLNDATINTHEEVVIKLTNYTSGTYFKNGTYQIVSNTHEIGSEKESIVKGQLLYLEGYTGAIDIVGGTVTYSGTYPETLIDFQLKLANGSTLEGNYYEGLEDFRYYF